MISQVATLGKTAITQNRWAQAQTAEQQYWDGMDGTELLRICAEKPSFLRQLPRRQLAALFDGKEVLEIGCGPLGISLASFYARKSAIKRLTKIEPLPRNRVSETVNGCDWSADIIAWAEALSEEGEYIQGSGEDLTHDQPGYDTVITYNVLDHVMDPALILANVWSALRPGGFLLVGVDCLSVLGRIKFELYHRQIRPNSISVHAHPHTFLPGDVQKMITRAGFTDISHFGARGFLKSWTGSCTRPAFIATKPAVSTQ